MVAKFITVVSYFMHLKFDNKLFSFLFYLGLVLAVFVYASPCRRSTSSRARARPTLHRRVSSHPRVWCGWPLHETLE